MKVERFSILGPALFTPKKFSDSRGFFMETFRHDLFCETVGEDIVFVQDNHSLSVPKGTLRGLHFQSPPHAQGKLVRCTKGQIIDVAVDIRTGSPTFGEYVKAELTSENAAQLWVPPGFLHGFLTLCADAEVQYKCTDYYAPSCDGNIAWNDPEISIDWGVDPQDILLSPKDEKAPFLKDFKSPF
jgi:dTDP-4-dehydrorhamnose 3,5-epimerase